MADASGGSQAAAASEAPRIKAPVQIQIANTEERSSMIKSFTVYIVHVSDFGRNYQVERRFDDFAKLHSELAPVDPSIPPIPEKKMWASTDASTVAERRPAFEKILRHMLRSEEVVFEKGQVLWKFLEMPQPGVVAARYMFKAERLYYARQCGKLLDPKYEKEHAYRLAHESLIKTNLNLLTTELAQLSAKTESRGPRREEASPSPESKPDKASASEDSAAGPGDATPSAPPPAQAEAAALEMLRWAIANGGEAGRRAFLGENGLSAMLNLLFKKGRQGPSDPDPHIRSVMNALVKAEGERFPHVFAEFLAGGGVSLLASVKDLFQHSQGFSEFISKLLWLAWDEEAQAAFLQGASKEALGLLSALFECPSRTARVSAGLLLSCLLASRLLEGKEAQAAAGVYRLVEEMVALSPAWTRDSSGTVGAATAPTDKAEAELAEFVQGLGKSDDRFARILGCADAPWRLHDGTLPHEEHPLWACCAFALWCLLKLRPKAARLQPLRPALPAVAQAAPARVRWLAGEFLLMLQLQSPAQLGKEGQGVTGEAIVEMTFQESSALEAALREQVEHSRHSLKAEIEQSQHVIKSQHGLIEERQRPLKLVQKAAWHGPLDEVLHKLGAVREKLSGSVGAAEASSESALTSVREVIQMDLGWSEAENRELELKLSGMREVEGSYVTKKLELAECQEMLTQQDKVVEEANAAMERADRVVQETRRQIAELETQISSKQRDAQSKRTIASSDFSALKGQLQAEMDSIKQKQTKIRERALRIQSGEPLQDRGGGTMDDGAKQEEMLRLKAEAAQLKARSAELQAEQQRMDTDPATLEQQAKAAEEAVQRLGQERESLRASLQDLEGQHAQAREVWQASMTSLQTARQAKELAERECSGLKQQLDAVWASWQPLWARRLEAWRGRIQTLASARQGGRKLVEAVGTSWERLRAERELRREVAAAVQELQGQLAALTQELAAVDDETLDALEEQ